MGFETTGLKTRGAPSCFPVATVPDNMRCGSWPLFGSIGVASISYRVVQEAACLWGLLCRCVEHVADWTLIRRSGHDRLNNRTAQSVHLRVRIACTAEGLEGVLDVAFDSDAVPVYAEATPSAEQLKAQKARAEWEQVGSIGRAAPSRPPPEPSPVHARAMSLSLCRIKQTWKRT